MATEFSLNRINTPQTWTPAELELLNKNWFTIEEAIKNVGAGFVGPQGPPGPPGAPGATGATGATGAPGAAATWPIGSVFIAVVSTNPNTLLGYGTWASIGAGRVLVGLDSGDTDFDTVEETGGAKTSTPSAHTGTAVADHGTITSTQDSVHVVEIDGAVDPVQNVSFPTHTHDVTIPAHSVTQPNTHSPMSVVQPYFVVYMWKRTA